MQVLQKAKARLLKARSKLVLGFGSKCFGNKTTVSPRGACFDTDSKPDTPKTEGPCIILFFYYGAIGSGYNRFHIYPTSRSDVEVLATLWAHSIDSDD